MRLLPVAVVVAAALVPEAARANCAAPVTYEVSVAGSAVTVCPRNFADRKCPDQGLLREGADGRFKLSDCDESGCFVDECVAPGTYKYGFVQPYACVSSSCGTFYYESAQVTAALGACQRTAGRAGPVAFAGEAPWGGDAEICGYGGPGLPVVGCGCAGVPGAVFALNGLALLVGGGLMLRKRARR